MEACAVLAGLGAFIHPVVSGVFAAALVALLMSRTSTTGGESVTDSEEVIAARSESAVKKQQAITSLSISRQARVDADRRENDFKKIIETDLNIKSYNLLYTDSSGVNKEQVKIYDQKISRAQQDLDNLSKIQLEEG